MVDDANFTLEPPIKKNKKRRKKKGEHRKNWEQLGERGVIGLSATPGLGITSAPIASKALPRLARRTIGAPLKGAMDVFDPNAQDGDGDNDVQDATKFERPAIPKAPRIKPPGITGRMTNMNPYIGDDNLVDKQASQVEKFQKWSSSGDWDSFDYEHYDWWTFPIDKGSSQYGYMYDVTGEPLERLKKNKPYLDSLRAAAILYTQSHGWNLMDKEPALSPTDLSKDRYLSGPLNGQRFFKIARSLQIHGLTPEFEAFREFVGIYRKSYRLGNDDYWDNPDRYVMKSRYRQNKDTPNKKNPPISGSMAGVGISPTVFPNNQGDPRKDLKFQKIYVDRDIRNITKDKTSNDLTFDWRDDDSRKEFVRRLRTNTLPNGYADFTGMNIGNGRHEASVKKGLNPKLDLDLLADLGLHWRSSRGKSYPGFADPYGLVFAHSISAANEETAFASQARDAKGYFAPTINPRLYWQRYENWIRNPLSVMRDFKGQEIGVRLYFKDNRELMIGEFNKRIEKLYDSINSKYGRDADFKPLPEHEDIFDPSEIPEFIRDQIASFLKSSEHEFQNRVNIDGLRKNILDIFERLGVSKLLNKINNNWLQKYLQSSHSEWLAKKMRAHPNYLRTSALDDLNFDDLSSGQALMNLAFMEHIGLPNDMNLNKLKTELYPEKVYTPEIVEALHRGELERAPEIFYDKIKNPRQGGPNARKISGAMSSGLPPKNEDLTVNGKKWKDRKRTLSPLEEIYSFESQVGQYPQNGPQGISYFRGADDWMEEQGKWVDCLLFRDENGRIRGILNHYPFELISPEDARVTEKSGNINIFIDPFYKNKQVGTKLLDEARRRYDIDLNKQTYSTEGAAFINAYVRKLPENIGKEPNERYNRKNRPSKIHMKMINKLEKKLDASSRLKLQKFGFKGPDGEEYDSSIITIGKRPVVIVDIYGVNVPFYMSSGAGSKETVTPGKWYPFFGVAKTGWFNKTNAADMTSYYGVPEFERAAEILNSLITRNDIPDSQIKWNNGDKEWGIFRNPYQTYTNYPVKDSVIKSLHKDMLPAERGDAKNLDKNILNVKTKIDKNKQSISGQMSTPDGGLAEFERDNTPSIPKKELTVEDVEITTYPDSDVPAFRLKPIAEIISIVHPDNPNKSNNPDLQNNDYDYKNYLNGVQHPTESQIKEIKKYIAEQEEKYKKITHGWKFVLSNGETKENFKFLPYLSDVDNPKLPNVDWVDVAASDGTFLFRVSKLKNLNEFTLRHDIQDPAYSKDDNQKVTADSLFEQVLHILTADSGSKDYPSDLLHNIMSPQRIPSMWDPPYGDLNMVKIDALIRGYDPSTKFARDNFSGVDLTFGDSPEAKFVGANITRAREAVRLNSEFAELLMNHLENLQKNLKNTDGGSPLSRMSSLPGKANETESLIQVRNESHGPNVPVEDMYQIGLYAFNYNAIDPFLPGHEMFHIAGGQGFDRHGDHTVNRMLKFVFPNHWHVMYNYVTSVQDFTQTLGTIPNWIQLPEKLLNQPRRDDGLGLPAPRISGQMSNLSNIKSINASNVTFDNKTPANLINHANSMPSAYLNLPEPTDDLDIARETGRPVSWLMPGQLHPALNEYYNGLVKELRGLNVSNGISYATPEERTMGQQSQTPGLEEQQRATVNKFTFIRQRHEMIFAALLQQLDVNDENDRGIIATGLVQRAASTVAQAVFLSQKYNSPNMTDEILADLQRRTEKVFDVIDYGLPVRAAVTVPADKLALILSDGRLKTQHETGTSMGNFNPDTRNVQEFAMFSIHPRTTQRPIYGSVRIGTVEESSDKTRQYGAATIMLKEEVLKRTTWTQSDSLSHQTSASALSPENKTWDGLYNQSLHQRTKDRYFWLENFNQQMEELGRTPETEQWPFIETQIHGGVNLTDIAYIIVDEDWYQDDPEELYAGFGPDVDENNWRESPKWIQISQIAATNNIPILFLREALEKSEVADDGVMR